MLALQVPPCIALNHAWQARDPGAARHMRVVPTLHRESKTPREVLVELFLPFSVIVAESVSLGHWKPNCTQKTGSTIGCSQEAHRFPILDSRQPTQQKLPAIDNYRGLVYNGRGA